jgi:hypothetical protein
MPKGLPVIPIFVVSCEPDNLNHFNIQKENSMSARLLQVNYKFTGTRDEYAAANLP